MVIESSTSIHAVLLSPIERLQSGLAERAETARLNQPTLRESKLSAGDRPKSIEVLAQEQFNLNESRLLRIHNRQTIAENIAVQGEQEGSGNKDGQVATERLGANFEFTSVRFSRPPLSQLGSQNVEAFIASIASGLHSEVAGPSVTTGKLDPEQPLGDVVNDPDDDGPLFPPADFDRFVLEEANHRVNLSERVESRENEDAVERAREDEVPKAERRAEEGDFSLKSHASLQADFISAAALSIADSRGVFDDFVVGQAQLGSLSNPKEISPLSHSSGFVDFSTGESIEEVKASQLDDTRESVLGNALQLVNPLGVAPGVLEDPSKPFQRDNLLAIEVASFESLAPQSHEEMAREDREYPSVATAVFSSDIRELLTNPPPAEAFERAEAIEEQRYIEENIFFQQRIAVTYGEAQQFFEHTFARQPEFPASAVRFA